MNMLQNSYKSRIESEITILDILLEYGKEVKYRNQLQGFGLTGSEFDKLDKGVSRSIFIHRKNYLINSKLIIKLLSKGKKSSYYSITPLGIVYLLNKIEKLDDRKLHKIFEIMNFFSETPHKSRLYKSKSIDKLTPSEATLFKNCLVNALKSVKIEESKKHTLVYAMDPLTYDLTTVYLQYTINSTIKREIDFTNPFSKMKHVSDVDFYHAIAAHIFRYFHVQLFNKLKNKSIPPSFGDEILHVTYSHYMNMWHNLNDIVEELFEKIEEVNEYKM